MNYYTNTDGDVYAYDDLQVAQGIVKAGLTKMTAAEVDAYRHPPIDISQAKNAKRAEINAALDAQAAPLVGSTPAAIQLSWPTQQAEVVAYQADNAAKTPFLDGMAKARGITREAMIVKAAARVTALTQTGPALAGTWQGLHDQIDAATTIEQVQAVEWPK